MKRIVHRVDKKLRSGVETEEYDDKNRATAFAKGVRSHSTVVGEMNREMEVAGVVKPNRSRSKSLGNNRNRARSLSPPPSPQDDLFLPSPAARTGAVVSKKNFKGTTITTSSSTSELNAMPAPSSSGRSKIGARALSFMRRNRSKTSSSKHGQAVRREVEGSTSSDSRSAHQGPKDPLFGDLEDDASTLVGSSDSYAFDSGDGTLSSSTQPQPATLVQATGLWTQALSELVLSPEMARFAGTSLQLTTTATRFAVSVALLPFVLPARMALLSTQMLFKAYAEIFSFAAQVVRETLAPALSDGDILQQREAAEGAEDFNTDEPTEDHENEGLIQKILGFPGWARGVAGEVAQGLGGHLLSMVAPSSLTQEAKDPELDLQRLRLDFEEPLAETLEDPAVVKKINESAWLDTNDSVGLRGGKLTSQYLLRVNDLQIFQQTGHGTGTSKVFYVDLDPKDRNPPLVQHALERFVANGLSLLSDNPTARLSSTIPLESRVFPQIQWSAEGSTKNLLARCAAMTAIDRVGLLSRETLVWSGSFKSSSTQGKAKDLCPGHDLPLFLARGLVRQSPRDMMEWLWDNTRTFEYNNFSMGRTTLLTLQDEILNPSFSESEEAHHVGTKVIRSETRVPFTQMTVQACTLMHVCPLPGGPEEGYVIISRTMDEGVAGDHVGDPLATKSVASEMKNSKKNEILWGMNVFRRVANHPHLTDLTSLSHVGSSLVPKFMGKRIGLMTIDDFFKNVRQPKTMSVGNR